LDELLKCGDNFGMLWSGRMAGAVVYYTDETSDVCAARILLQRLRATLRFGSRPNNGNIVADPASL
jgi:hypothetical protein